ncbi:MAG: hypothetical protein CHACPFDD_02540 [Phycisphaerae bacterium]|nr:hypothetical protein [Phycisphaerae bacterium]
MDTDDIQSKLQRAGELLDAGEPEEALRCLEGLEGTLVDADDRIEHASLRAWALSQVNENTEALQLIRPLIEEFPDSVRLHTTHGIVLSNLNRLGDARAALELALSLDESDAVALANLGYVHEQAGDLDAALRSYEQAAENGADVAWILQRRAAVQRELEDYPAARKTLLRYLSLAPDDEFEWISLAIVHSELGEYESAFECYQRAEQINRDSTDLRFNWGLTAERAGRMEEAHAQLSLLDTAAPRSPQTCILRAFIHEHEGDLKSAMAAHLEAIERAAEFGRDSLAYAIEQAMEFCVTHQKRKEGEALMKRAYARDACTVELCAAYRELNGRFLDQGYWYNVMIEIDRKSHAVERPPEGGNNGKLPGSNGQLGGWRDRSGAPRRAGRNSPPPRESNGRREVPADPTSHGAGGDGPRRILRCVQLIASDRDDGISLLNEFLTRMGERRAVVAGFTDEDPVEDEYGGIYEVEPLDDAILASESDESE